MNSQDVTQRVKEILNKDFELPLDLLTPEATLFDDLKLDSLDAIDLVVRLEESLDVKVPSERFQNVRTLGDVFVLVSETVAESKPNA